MRLFVFSMREFDEKQFFDKFCAMYGIEYGYTTQTPCMENLHLAQGYDVVDIITTVFDREMIDRLKSMGVKCITTRTIGYDHIDWQYAKSLDMGVVNVTYSAGSVADYTVMLMIMGCRRIKHIVQRAAINDFSLEGKIGVELSNCTVGIIGTGKIGSRVVENLQGFGCKIIAYDIRRNEALEGKVTYTDLDTLYRESDIITLHAPSTRENYHMINDESLARMKDGVMIINCARGSLIDTKALIAGINSGKVGFAGLDVIENESGLYYFNHCGKPLDNTDLAVLNSYSNVIVLPHTAFYTNQAVSDMAQNSITGAMEYMENRHDD